MRQYKFLTRFLISAFLLYLAWFLLYESWLKPSGFPDRHLTRHTTEVSAGILRLMDYDIVFYHNPYKSSLYLETQRLLGVAHECNGLILFALFIGFVVCFPAAWFTKLWFSVAGVAAIWVVNIIRVVALTLVQIHFPASLDFNHKYTFTLLVYGFIFGLWMLWVKKFAQLSPPVSKAKNVAYQKD